MGEDRAKTPRSDVDSVSVIGKTRLILDCFRFDEVSLTLTEISNRTGLPMATTYRLAGELVDWGMLERETRSYRLGMRAFELGGHVQHLRALRDTVRPHMEQLHALFGETVHLAVRDGFDVVYVEMLNSQSQWLSPARPAGRMPLHSTATGKILIAFGQRTLLDAVLESGLAKVTPSTLTDPRLFREQIALARRHHHVTERDESVEGYASTAAPVIDRSGVTVAALSITAPKDRHDPQSYAAALLALRPHLAVLDLAPVKDMLP